MKDKKKPFGYTVVEVMIVLAVSGMMFVVAATFINGKQAKTSFSTGVNETASRIQDTIEQVNRGKYSDIRLNCVLSGSTVSVTAGTGTTPQGANPPCVFIGKFLHFSVAGDRQQYEIFSLAGLRDKTTLDTAGVTTINNGAADLTVSAKIPQGLQVESVKVNGTPSYGFGFAQGLGSASADGYGYESGSQNISLISASGLTDSLASNDAASQITGSNLNSDKPKKVVICLTDGTRYATITLGDNDNELIARTKLGLSSCP